MLNKSKQGASQNLIKNVVVRLSLVATGALIVECGLQMMHKGVFAYQNSWFRGTNYSAGTVAAGVFIGLLAFLPPTSWVTRLIGGKKTPTHDQLTYARRRHKSK
jgi:hypothetical protein